jgi:hypothetical protein
VLLLYEAWFRDVPGLIAITWTLPEARWSAVPLVAQPVWLQHPIVASVAE